MANIGAARDRVEHAAAVVGERLLANLAARVARIERREIHHITDGERNAHEPLVPKGTS